MSILNYPSKEFKSKNIWTKIGKNFLIEISRHSVDLPYGTTGVHRWCIYAYIYPSHSLFTKFDLNSENSHQDVVYDFPLHGGCTYFRYHYNSSHNVTSVQIGCDYNHLGDDHLTHYSTEEDALEVFLDAMDLFEFLESND